MVSEQVKRDITIGGQERRLILDNRQWQDIERNIEGTIIWTLQEPLKRISMEFIQRFLWGCLSHKWSMGPNLKYHALDGWLTPRDFSDHTKLIADMVKEFMGTEDTGDDEAPLDDTAEPETGADQPSGTVAA